MSNLRYRREIAMPSGVTSITITGEGGIVVERNGNAFTIGLDGGIIADVQHLAQHANARIDAGIAEAIATVTGVRDAVQALPNDFNNHNFEVMLAQMKVLSAVLVAMLQAQEE